MCSEIVIKVSNLSKCYDIYDKPHERLLQMLSSSRKRYYREFWALKDVSFEIKKGDTVGIIGRNGSGKSTLLQLICGTLNPTSGSIEVKGRVAALLELGSGFNPEFTGRENVYINAAILGLAREEVDQRFNDIIRFADIGSFIEQPVKTYSSGMMLRLAFSVIAHVDADILVVDEALAVGDVFFTQKCMRFLREFMKTGTVLFVSHDTAAVINLCNHALWLNKGLVQLAGSPKDVAEKYLEKQYLEDRPEASGDRDISLTHFKDEPANYHDMRRDFINASSFRNDIKVIQFNAETAAYGSGSGVITSAFLEDIDGKPLAWVVGGEMVRLAIQVHMNAELEHLLFGFNVKDRLGQNLIGDNTFLTYMDNPLNGNKGETWRAVFTFRMPVLPPGDYTVDVAFGSGAQDDHIIHHWARDALAFKSDARTPHMGLVGIPMFNITASALAPQMTNPKRGS